MNLTETREWVARVVGLVNALPIHDQACILGMAARAVGRNQPYRGGGRRQKEVVGVLSDGRSRTVREIAESVFGVSGRSEYATTYNALLVLFNKGVVISEKRLTGIVWRKK